MKQKHSAALTLDMPGSRDQKYGIFGPYFLLYIYQLLFSLHICSPPPPTFFLSDSFIRPGKFVAIHLLTHVFIFKKERLFISQGTYVKTSVKKKLDRSWLSSYMVWMVIRLSSHKSYGIDFQHQEIDDGDTNYTKRTLTHAIPHWSYIIWENRNYESWMGTKAHFAIYLLCVL